MLSPPKKPPLYTKAEGIISKAGRHQTHIVDVAVVFAISGTARLSYTYFICPVSVSRFHVVVTRRPAHVDRGAVCHYSMADLERYIYKFVVIYTKHKTHDVK